MQLADYLMHFIGKPYIWGGSGAVGFDCSGLVLEGLWALGMFGGGDTTAQGLCDNLAKTGWTSQPSAKIRRDDLLFFGKDRKHITHVAVALDRRLMIEAGGGGSKCTSAANSSGMVRVRPIRSDLVEVLRE